MSVSGQGAVRYATMWDTKLAQDSLNQFKNVVTSTNAPIKTLDQTMKSNQMTMQTFAQKTQATVIPLQQMDKGLQQSVAPLQQVSKGSQQLGKDMQATTAPMQQVSKGAQQIGKDTQATVSPLKQMTKGIQDVEKSAKSVNGGLNQMDSGIKNVQKDISTAEQKMQGFNLALNGNSKAFSSNVNAIKSGGPPLANYQRELDASGKGVQSFGEKAKTTFSRFSGFATGLSATTTGVLQLGAGFRDYSDAQIAVERQQRKVSLADEAVQKAQAKLNQLANEGKKGSAEYKQASLDLSQALQNQSVQTQMLGEKQEDMFDSQSQFIASVIPTTLGAVGTLGSAFRDLSGTKGMGAIKTGITGLIGSFGEFAGAKGIGGIKSLITGLASEIGIIGTSAAGATGGVTAFSGALSGMGKVAAGLMAVGGPLLAITSWWETLPKVIDKAKGDIILADPMAPMLAKLKEDEKQLQTVLAQPDIFNKPIETIGNFFLKFGAGSKQVEIATERLKLTQGAIKLLENTTGGATMTEDQFYKAFGNVNAIAKTTGTTLTNTHHSVVELGSDFKWTADQYVTESTKMLDAGKSQAQVEKWLTDSQMHRSDVLDILSAAEANHANHVTQVIAGMESYTEKTGKSITATGQAVAATDKLGMASQTVGTTIQKYADNSIEAYIQKQTAANQVTTVGENAMRDQVPEIQKNVSAWLEQNKTMDAGTLIYNEHVKAAQDIHDSLLAEAVAQGANADQLKGLIDTRMEDDKAIGQQNQGLLNLLKTFGPLSQQTQQYADSLNNTGLVIEGVTDSDKKFHQQMLANIDSTNLFNGTVKAMGNTFESGQAKAVAFINTSIKGKEEQDAYRKVLIDYVEGQHLATNANKLSTEELEKLISTTQKAGLVIEGVTTSDQKFYKQMLSNISLTEYLMDDSTKFNDIIAAQSDEVSKNTQEYLKLHDALSGYLDVSGASLDQMTSWNQLLDENIKKVQKQKQAMQDETDFWNKLSPAIVDATIADNNWIVAHTKVDEILDGSKKSLLALSGAFKDGVIEAKDWFTNLVLGNAKAEAMRQTLVKYANAHHLVQNAQQLTLKQLQDLITKYRDTTTETDKLAQATHEGIVAFQDSLEETKLNVTQTAAYRSELEKYVTQQGLVADATSFTTEQLDTLRKASQGDVEAINKLGAALKTIGDKAFQIIDVDKWKEAEKNIKKFLKTLDFSKKGEKAIKLELTTEFKAKREIDKAQQDLTGLYLEIKANVDSKTLNKDIDTTIGHLQKALGKGANVQPYIDLLNNIKTAKNPTAAFVGAIEKLTGLSAADILTDSTKLIAALKTADPTEVQKYADSLGNVGTNAQDTQQPLDEAQQALVKYGKEASAQVEIAAQMSSSITTSVGEMSASAIDSFGQMAINTTASMVAIVTNAGTMADSVSSSFDTMKSNVTDHVAEMDKGIRPHVSAIGTMFNKGIPGALGKSDSAFETFSKTAISEMKAADKGIRPAVSNIGTMFGKGIVGAVGKATQALKDFKKALDNIPNNTTKTVTIKINRQGDTGGGGNQPQIVKAQHGMHETLERDTTILAHRGERVDIGIAKPSRSSSFSMGDQTIIINVLDKTLVNKLKKQIGSTVYQYGA